MNELKRYMPGGLQLFPFYLVAPYSVCFLMEFEATLNNAMFVGRWGKYIYLQWSSIFQKVDPGGWRGQVQIGTFLSRKYESGIKESNAPSSC